MRTFTRGERLAVLLLTALLILGGGLGLLRVTAARRAAAAVAVARDGAAAGADAGVDAGDRQVRLRSPAAAELLVVHVAGAVRRPGLYRLAPPARVADAIAAAGGAVPGANLDSVNLAAPLKDGQKVTVTRARSPARGSAGGSAGAGGKTGTGAGAGTGTGSAGGPAVVDINTAGADDLDRLPGVGPVIAARIVEYREGNGPFKSVDGLLAVSGIGPHTLEDLRPYVTVGGQAEATAAAPASGP